MTFLSEAERQALLPHLTDEISPAELEALDRAFHRSQAARELVVFAMGMVGGVAVAVLVFAAWVFGEA